MIKSIFKFYKNQSKFFTLQIRPNYEFLNVQIQTINISDNQKHDNTQILDLTVIESLKEIKKDEKPQIGIEFKGRNSRQPTQSNHGARPCSSYMRRLKKTDIIKVGNLKNKDEDNKKDNNLYPKSYKQHESYLGLVNL